MTSPRESAGRGDATQPDPAVIERAAEALWNDSRLDRWNEATDSERLGYLRQARAAAAVIVPATAEAIAAAQEALAEQHRPSMLPPPHTAEDHAWYAGVRDAARLARKRFAAGLSADATGGDSDE